MIPFRVVPDAGDPFDVVAGTRDVLVWEKTGKGKVFSQLMENIAMVDMYRLAHIASRREGLFSGTLVDFENSVEITFEEIESPDPTRPAPSAGPSSPSPSRPASPRPPGRKKANKQS